MNIIQQIMLETEKSCCDYKVDNEGLRQQTLKEIDKQIERLVRRKRRIEQGHDDYVMFDE